MTTLINNKTNQGKKHICEIFDIYLKNGRKAERCGCLIGERFFDTDWRWNFQYFIDENRIKVSVEFTKFKESENFKNLELFIYDYRNSNWGFPNTYTIGNVVVGKNDCKFRAWVDVGLFNETTKKIQENFVEANKRFPDEG